MPLSSGLLLLLEESDAPFGRWRIGDELSLVPTIVAASLIRLLVGFSAEPDNRPVLLSGLTNGLLPCFRTLPFTQTALVRQRTTKLDNALSPCQVRLRAPSLAYPTFHLGKRKYTLVYAMRLTPSFP